MRFVRKSASDMNATGEGDRRKWYDKCRSIQEDNKRNILTMYGIVAGKIADDGRFITFPDYVFDPLEEATEKELAENIKAYTDVATALAGLGANPDSLIEWLKQFKQFHLDSIEFDTATPGLDGYDDDDPNGGGGLPDITGGANIGDGFKVREDITPKVLAAFKVMNAKEDKNGMLHDEGNGQFTSGGDSGFNKPGDDVSSGDKQDLSDVFGEAFTEFSGRPKEAIEKLLWEKRGHVPAAINKDGVGDIDFVWGEPGIHGYGLAHIIERRDAEGKDGTEFVQSLPGIIDSGTVDFRHQKLGRLYITSKDKNVVIRLDWNGIERNWLATAFEIYK